MADNKSKIQRALDHALAIKDHYEQMADIFSSLVLSAQKGSDYNENFRKDFIEGIEYGGGTVTSIEDEMAAYIPAKFRKGNGDVQVAE